MSRHLEVGSRGSRCSHARPKRKSLQYSITQHVSKTLTQLQTYSKDFVFRRPILVVTVGATKAMTRRPKIDHLAEYTSARPKRPDRLNG